MNPTAHPFGVEAHKGAPTQDILGGRPAMCMDGGCDRWGNRGVEHPHLLILNEQCVMGRSGDERIEFWRPPRVRSICLRSVWLCRVGPLGLLLCASGPRKVERTTANATLERNAASITLPVCNGRPRHSYSYSKNLAPQSAARCRPPSPAHRRASARIAWIRASSRADEELASFPNIRKLADASA